MNKRSREVFIKACSLGLIYHSIFITILLLVRKYCDKDFVQSVSRMAISLSVAGFGMLIVALEVHFSRGTQTTFCPFHCYFKARLALTTNYTTLVERGDGHRP